MHPPPLDVPIPARNRRQAMDWSLVLASQGIEHRIDHDETSGWTLTVADAAHAAALRHLRLYREENRYWRWRRPVFQPGFYFDGTSLIWVMGIALIYAWSQHHDLRGPGMMTRAALDAGEWWRLFTAVWLHADLAHLAMNAVFGLLFLGLAMGSYGPGVGMLAAYLSGAAGNLASGWIHGPALHGLGASGMVMGALGLLTCPPLVLPRGKKTVAYKMLAGGLLAGICIFMMVGVNPETDIIAHLGGFVTGWLLGLMLAINPRLIRSPRANLAAGILFAILLIFPWYLALNHP